jgi:NADH:ubiquinone oxidoreductase subunit E
MEEFRSEREEIIMRQQSQRTSSAVFGYVYMTKKQSGFWPTIEKVGKALGISFKYVEEIAENTVGLALVEPSWTTMTVPLHDKEVAVEWMLN